MSNFYKDTNCLVIGGAGFAGLHLVKMLQNNGAKVTVLDNLTRRGSLPGLYGATFHYGDCSYEGVCRDAFKDQQYIFNLAAWVAGVDYNQRNQAEMYYRNWLAQMTPFRIAHEYSTERFLSVSSVCVYAPGYNSPCQEENGFKGEPVKANLGYSLSKRAGERMAIWYNDAGLYTVRVRPSNLYGPGDYFDNRAHVIPALIRKALKDDIIIVNGTGKERREFLHVEDAARGMMAALARGKAGEVYNLGAGGHTCISISALARLIRANLHCHSKDIVFQHRFDSGDDVRWSMARKARDDFGWSYQISIDEGLEETVNWYVQENQTT